MNGSTDHQTSKHESEQIAKATNLSQISQFDSLELSLTTKKVAETLPLIGSLVRNFDSEHSRRVQFG